MIVKYRVRRSDIWRAYWYLWRRSVKMKLVQAVVFASVVNFVVLLQAESSTSTSEKFAVAMLIAFLAIALFPLYPFLQFKPEERMLRIRPGGISTTIGRKSGDIPWTAVERVVVETDCGATRSDRSSLSWRARGYANRATQLSVGEMERGQRSEPSS